MRVWMITLLRVFSLVLAITVPISAQNSLNLPADKPDLTKDPTLYVVAYAHLDTQWRWQYPQVINEFLPKTMHDNFALFEKYPHYVFNFSGANRYRMMKEYWPNDYARLKSYVAAGRWFPAGSSMEESDVNSPSAESIIRQILYGNRFFQREFGKTSAEYMLPDCFGFPASLPSILAHAGIRGFSTQKLTWNSAAPGGGKGSIENTPEGIPFNVGFWRGPDGRGVIAALNPGSYGGQVRDDLSKSPVITDPNARNNPIDWPRRVQLNGKVTGLFTDYHYYGTGDVGGSPREDSVRAMEAIVTRNPALMPVQPGGSTPTTVGDGPLKVVSATAEQMFLSIPSQQVSRLPVYQGDLLLTNHSAGSISSETYQKRWNRKNELLADAAEKASIAASWLGQRTYPQERLNNAWTLVMGGQFHDILPGTATPKAFEYSWNDDVLALNQFAGVLTSATAGVTAVMNTETVGQAIVVYNPLNISREDVVEASISFKDGAPKSIRVVDANGKETPSQIIEAGTNTPKILFLARVPSVGYAVYDVQPSTAQNASSNLKVTTSSLENDRYQIKLNPDGDVNSIVDKSLNREIIESPLRLTINTDKPSQWPAWNMDWSDQQKSPRTVVHGPAQIRIVENGPVRVAVEITREAEKSKFVQTIRLSAGDAGNRVELANVIDWKTSEANLKATFPLTAANTVATYNWDIGTIERSNNDEKKFEVPSHQWFDLTDRSGAFGVTILSDCKNGSDKPDDKTLRLTLLRTPGISPRAGYADQSTQDWGHHEFIYGLASHSNDWRRAQTDWQAQRLNQPLIAFQSDKHRGRMGKSFSMLHVDNDRVRVLALKKAEDTGEVIVRIVELDGKPQSDVKLSFATPVLSAREVDGQEHPIGAAKIVGGKLQTSLSGYQPRTFALRLKGPSIESSSHKSQPIPLAYETSVATANGQSSTVGFDGKGRALPADMLPAIVDFGSVSFKLGPASGPNAITPHGQKIPIPKGARQIYFLMAATSEDQTVVIQSGVARTKLTVQKWDGFIGQWDNRNWKQTEVQVPARTPPAGTPPDIAAQLLRPRTRIDPYAEMTSITPGFIKRDPIAWFSSHHHTASGANEAYAYCYLFAYAVDVPLNADSITLPENDQLRILAISSSSDDTKVWPAQPLYDTLEP